mgnify:CR=1 FL=1
MKRAQGQLAAARYYLGQADLLAPDSDAIFRELADPKLFADLAELTAPASPGFARGVGFRVGDTAARLDGAPVELLYQESERSRALRARNVR